MRGYPVLWTLSVIWRIVYKTYQVLRLPDGKELEGVPVSSFQDAYAHCGCEIKIE